MLSINSGEREKFNLNPNDYISRNGLEGLGINSEDIYLMNIIINEKFNSVLLSKEYDKIKKQYLTQFILLSLRGPSKPLANQLLWVMIHKEEIADVINLIAENYSLVGKEFQDLLFSYAIDDRWAGDVALGIARHFSKLPLTVQNLLRQLVQTRLTDPKVGTAIVFGYNNLPTDIRNQISIFAKQVSVQGELAWSIASSVEFLPDEIIQLLYLLEIPLLELLQRDFYSHVEPPIRRWVFLRPLIFSNDARLAQIQKKVMHVFENCTYNNVRVWLHRFPTFIQNPAF